MTISADAVNNALSSWLRRPDMTQENATRIITASYLADGGELALSRIEFDDGTVDFDAWRRNRINIFQRWRKCETAEHRRKFTLLIPHILESLQRNAPELHEQLVAGDSIRYRATQALKESVEAINSALLGAPLTDVERECAEAEYAISALRNACQQQRHDQ